MLNERRGGISVSWRMPTVSRHETADHECGRAVLLRQPAEQTVYLMAQHRDRTVSDARLDARMRDPVVPAGRHAGAEHDLTAACVDPTVRLARLAASSWRSNVT